MAYTMKEMPIDTHFKRNRRNRFHLPGRQVEKVYHFAHVIMIHRLEEKVKCFRRFLEFSETVRGVYTRRRTICGGRLFRDCVFGG